MGQPQGEPAVPPYQNPQSAAPYPSQPVAPYPPQPPAAYNPPFAAAYPPQGGESFPPPQAAEKPPRQPAAYPPPHHAAYPPQGAGGIPPPQPEKPPQQPAAYPPPQQAAHTAPQPVSYPPQQPAAYSQAGAYVVEPLTPFHVVQETLPTPWTTSLFDCLDDPSNAVITLCCPCVTFGQIAEIIDKGHTTCVTGGAIYGVIAAFTGFPCIYSCSFRSKLRAMFGLVEAPAPDFLVHLVCEPCALCQIYRELRNRGWDPTIGWQANNARQTVQVAMIPPTQQVMMS